MSLTIVMPLKGRIEFTLRFLRHVELCKMPFRFFLADGLVRGLESKLKDFPEVNTRYMPYPDDTDWHRYFTKLHDAISQVETPFVMIAENDDFLGPEGIKCAVNFLCANLDYACCGGGVAGFSINEGLLGPMNHLTYSYTGEPSGDVESDDVKTRILNGFECHWPFYAVYRTEVLKAIWGEIVEMNPTNFYVTEHFQTLRALSFGKAHLIQSVTSYFKQANTSMAGHWITSESNPDASFVYHLIRSRFSEDLNVMIERISGGDEAFNEQLRLSAEPWVERLFKNNYGLRTQLEKMAPSFHQWIEKRNTIRRDKKRIYRALKDNGATRQYMRQFYDELSAIELVLSDNKLRTLLQ